VSIRSANVARLLEKQQSHAEKCKGAYRLIGMTYAW